MRTKVTLLGSNAKERTCCEVELRDQRASSSGRSSQPEQGLTGAKLASAPPGERGAGSSQQSAATNSICFVPSASTHSLAAPEALTRSTAIRMTAMNVRQFTGRSLHDHPGAARVTYRPRSTASSTRASAAFANSCASLDNAAS